MKILSIINPVSGTKKAISVYNRLKIREPVFEKSTSHITQYPGHASDLIKTIDLSLYEAIVVFGGDGTIHEVINGMMQREDKVSLPIGVLPLGTGNALMHHLNILTIDAAIARILKRKSQFIDLLECKTATGLIYSFNMVGWGIPVTINDQAERLRIFGKQRYNISSIIEIFKNRNWPCSIVLDDDVIEGNITFFMTCNTRYTGKGMHIAPTAVLDDGQMQVVILQKQNRRQLIKLFAQVFSGTHTEHPHIIYRSVRTIEVVSQHSMPLIIDGQQVGMTPLEINILPKKIALLV